MCVYRIVDKTFWIKFDDSWLLSVSQKRRSFGREIFSCFNRTSVSLACHEELEHNGELLRLQHWRKQWHCCPSGRDLSRKSLECLSVPEHCKLKRPTSVQRDQHNFHSDRNLLERFHLRVPLLSVRNEHPHQHADLLPTVLPLEHAGLLPRV